MSLDVCSALHLNRLARLKRISALPSWFHTCGGISIELAALFDSRLYVQRASIERNHCVGRACNRLPTGNFNTVKIGVGRILCQTDGVVVKHNADRVLLSVCDVSGGQRIVGRIELDIVLALRKLADLTSRGNRLRRVEYILAVSIHSRDRERRAVLRQNEVILQTSLRCAVLRHGNNNLPVLHPIGDYDQVGQVSIRIGRAAQVAEVIAVLVEGSESESGPSMQRLPAGIPAEGAVRVHIELARLVKVSRLNVLLASHIIRPVFYRVRLLSPLGVEDYCAAVI